ncbi:hypothetical protein EG68_10775 [Paragonimus skrjabini miyazakii]|uniref:Uncharacterized protein n=1 Tax=Paragonimus skrjabini miyazakii TaxID=59628 RepID=A0A8S9YKF8_9TREM|nr:hypothetical protein EG68_10775 [Paragonimus skrjabini miyazakii]
MSGAFVDLDSSLLVKLSDTLKDRICAKTFVNLQKRVNDEIAQTDEVIQQTLREEQKIKDHWDEVFKSKSTNKRQKSVIQNEEWNRNQYLPCISKIQDYVEENIFEKREQLRVAYTAYLDHVKKVGHVHLDVIASDNYDPLATDDKTVRTLKSAPGKQAISARVRRSQTLPPTLNLTEAEKPKHFKNNRPSISQPKNEQPTNEQAFRCMVEHAKCKFDLQWRPVPGPEIWQLIHLTYIESEKRAKSRSVVGWFFHPEYLSA